MVRGGGNSLRRYEWRRRRKQRRESGTLTGSGPAAKRSDHALSGPHSLHPRDVRQRKWGTAGHLSNELWRQHGRCLCRRAARAEQSRRARRFLRGRGSFGQHAHRRIRSGDGRVLAGQASGDLREYGGHPPDVHRPRHRRRARLHRVLKPRPNDDLRVPGARGCGPSAATAICAGPRQPGGAGRAPGGRHVLPVRGHKHLDQSLPGRRERGRRAADDGRADRSDGERHRYAAGELHLARGGLW